MTPKYTRFQDIPQFTRGGNYTVDVHWQSVERTLADFDCPPDSPLELDPDFQRGHVWTKAKQIAYVEFILRGGRSSKVIFFNQPSWNNAGAKQGPMQLVDGKQRLEAVRQFMRGELPIFGNCFAGDFTDSIRLSRGAFLFTVNDLQTRTEVLQWYLDLNEGGVVHTEAELSKVRDLLAAERQSFGL